MDIFILTTNQDHDGSVLDVEADRWIAHGERSKVLYLSKSKRDYRTIKQAIHEASPDVVYMNGMYSIPFVVYPFRILKNNKHVKKIIAPRGMLQTESLSIKPLKKKAYLNFLKLFFLNKYVHWHVTTEQEYTDLTNFISKNRQITLLGNVPSFDPDHNLKIPVLKEKTHFGTVALISPMKNIHLIISAMTSIQDQVDYHLYGPVKDENYWKDCQELINDLPENIEIHYHGEILPGEVPHKISTFDFYIQPSRSENFGHSIFEAFNQGVPVIISDQTPWKGLKEKHAGWDVNLSYKKSLTNAIHEALQMDEKAYLQNCKGARRMAEQYMESHDFQKLYLELFG